MKKKKIIAQTVVCALQSTSRLHQICQNKNKVPHWPKTKTEWGSHIGKKKNEEPARKQSQILDRTFSISSLLRIFPVADFGTLFMNVTIRSLLKGATCNRKQKQITTYCRYNNFGSKIEIEEIDQLGSQMSLVCIVTRYLISYDFFDIFFSQGTIWRTYNISSRDFASFSIRKPVGWK